MSRYRASRGLSAGLLPGLLAGLALLSSCARQFEVPVPVVSMPPDIPPQEPAVIALPVTIALGALRNQLGAQFPPVDSLDRARCISLGGLLCHQYVYHRDTLDVRMQGDRFMLHTRLRYRGRVGVPGVGGIASCGYAPEAMKRAELRISTALYWTADWRIATRGTVLSPQLGDPCEVTLLRVDATPLMRRLLEAQLESLKRMIDSAVVTAADLRPVADSLWQTMQRPVALDSASTAWLVMSPEGASLAPLSGDSASVHTTIVLTARPRIVVGAAPPAETRPLPGLTLARPANGLRVPIQIEIPFADLSERATALLAGQVAGNGITVNDVRIWGAGDTAVVKVGVQGKVSGSLYLLGRVAYDSAARTVLIDDLRYTLASGNAMSRIKATLGSGRIKRGIDEATGGGRLRIGDQLDSLRARLTQEMNREVAPGVSIVGSVREVRIDRLFTTQTAFVLRVILDGDARLEVR